MPSGSTLP